jgi:hypothetical protein
MTAKNRYWDHDRCAWVAYEAAVAAPASAGTPELAAESLPGQRADEPAPATGPAATGLNRG